MKIIPTFALLILFGVLNIQSQTSDQPLDQPLIRQPVQHAILPLIIMAAASAAGSVASSNATKKAAGKQANSQVQINQEQLDFARELRGEGGSPVFLPLYSRDRETELFDIADSLFTSAVPSGDRAGEVEATVAPFADAYNAAFADSQSGALTGRKLSNTDPVRGARTKAASSKLDAINQALDDILSQQNASESTKGFAGGGSFRNNRALQSTLGARQSAADAMSAAELANATEIAGIRNQGDDLAFQLAMQSPELANAALGLERAPSTVPIQEYLDAIQVFQPFNTSQGNAIAGQLVGGLRAPQFTGVSPTANALGSVAGSLSQYAAYQQQQKMMDGLMNQSVSNYRPIDDYGLGNASIFQGQGMT
jgi:hypothetical protein